MQLKHETLADGYTLRRGQIGVMSGGPAYILTELIDQGVVDVESFGLGELEEVLKTTRKYKVFGEEETIEYWLPDISDRLAELDIGVELTSSDNQGA